MEAEKIFMMADLWFSEYKSTESKPFEPGLRH